MAQTRNVSTGYPKLPSLQEKADDNEQYSGFSNFERIVYPELREHLEGVPIADVKKLTHQYSVSQEFYDQEDIDSDYMHKAMRLVEKIANVEPTPKLVRATSAHQGEPINEKELGNLPVDELAEEVIQ